MFEKDTENNRILKLRKYFMRTVAGYLIISFFADLHEDIGQGGGSADRGQTPGFRVFRSGNTVPSEWWFRFFFLVFS